MWNKPEAKEPKFKELTENELKDINGGSVGTCYVVGYTCWTSGALKVGTCYVVGYACTRTKGGF